MLILYLLNPFCTRFKYDIDINAHVKVSSVFLIFLKSTFL